MAIDMKTALASAAEELIFEKGIDKVTIKDIVAKCNITRQTFYYHFEDFDDLLRWAFNRDIGDIFKKSSSQENMKDSIRVFIEFAVEYKPLLEKTKNSKRRDDFQNIISNIMKKYIGKMLKEKTNIDIIKDITIGDMELALKFYSFGILGIIFSTDIKDEKDIDDLAEDICNLMTGKIKIFYN